MIAHLLVALLSFAAPCYRPPVDAPISVPFVMPACAWCPGHRGVEYSLPAGTPVTAVQAGVVTFSGVVAGTRYVVVLQPDGLRATYGMLGTASVGRGQTVSAGQVVGASTARLYFGLRDAADLPVDPTPLFGVWLGRPRLVPADGHPPRAGPPPRLMCAAA